MIIIDKPFASKFLIDTIRENCFPIISTAYTKELIKDKSLNWITETEAKSIFKQNPTKPLYTNSENSISWIENNLSSSNLPNQIHVFKNKIKFRELLKDSFPNYFFKGIKYKALHTFDIEGINFPVIIKPAVGFFSLGVHKVDNIDEWNLVLEKIGNEIDSLNGMYPKEVIDVSDFIIEEYFEGEEYAIDCYFNNMGEPIILNILHHIFSSENDVSDRVYSTSKEIIESHHKNVLNFLKSIGAKTGLINFPAHVEIRINSDGKIKPIEVNPLRFGGWCTTGDLSWYAYGFNSYEYFLKGKSPDWKEIFKTKKNKKYNIIVLDNNSGIDGSEIESFNYKKLLKDFSKPLSLRKANFNKFPVFGFLFVETTNDNEEELKNILNSNLRKYIKVKSTCLTKR